MSHEIPLQAADPIIPELSFEPPGDECITSCDRVFALLTTTRGGPWKRIGHRIVPTFEDRYFDYLLGYLPHIDIDSRADEVPRHGRRSKTSPVTSAASRIWSPSTSRTSAYGITARR
jgi:hypothetical protein